MHTCIRRRVPGVSAGVHHVLIRRTELLHHAKHHAHLRRVKAGNGYSIATASGVDVPAGGPASGAAHSQQHRQPASTSGRHSDMVSVRCTVPNSPIIIFRGLMHSFYFFGLFFNCFYALLSISWTLFGLRWPLTATAPAATLTSLTPVSTLAHWRHDTSHTYMPGR